MYEVDLDVLEGLEGAEKRQAEEALAELARLATANPLQFWHPHPGQVPFLEAGRVKHKFLAAGNRFGKTEVGVVDDLIQCVDRECLPPHLQAFKFWEPPFECRIVSGDFTATMDGVLFEKLRKLCPKDQLSGGGWDKAYSKDLRKLLFRNGSYIQFLTTEQDVEKHAGASLDRVHFDEEPPGDKGYTIYRENLVRTTDRGGQVCFTMTPLLGLSWTYESIYERRGEPGFFVIGGSMLDNPYLLKENVDVVLEGLSDDEVKAIRDGQFVHFKGRVFDEFTRDGPLVVDKPARDHIRDLDCLVGIDPGIRRSGVIWVGFDRDNNAIAFDELYLTDMTVDRIAVEIRRKNELWGLDPDCYIIDPSARNRSLSYGESVESEFLRFGIPCVHGMNDREAGTFQLKRRFQSTPPGLLVSEDCPSLIFELERYRHEGVDGEFKPLKKDDHLIDPLRYVCMARAWGSPTPQRRVQPPRWDQAWRPKFITEYSPPTGAMT